MSGEDVWLITHVNDSNAYIIEADTFGEFDVYSIYDPIYIDTFKTPLMNHANDLCGALNPEYIPKIFDHTSYYIVSCFDIHQNVKGFLYAYEINPNEIYIHVICAKEGYGKKLMTSFLHYVKEKTSYTTISLSSMFDVIGFYLKNDFTIRNTCASIPFNANSRSHNIAQFRNMYGNLKKRQTLLYDLYKHGAFADSCGPDLTFEEFLNGGCFLNGVHMIYCFQDNAPLPKFNGAYPKVPVVTNMKKGPFNIGDENNIPVESSNNFPHFPQEKINQLQKEYSRSQRIGRSRPNNILFEENNKNKNNNGYSANNEKNVFGEPLRSLGVPRIPSKLLEQAEREYRRRWKLGGTRKRKVSRRRTLKKHGK